MKNFARIIKDIFKFYPVKLPFVIFLIIFCAGVNTMPSVFIQKIIFLIENLNINTSWPVFRIEIIKILSVLLIFYVLSLLGAYLNGQIGAEITQGILMQFRQKMFNSMENLPVKYFDTNPHGDIMSRYTNDVDSMRQMISQALPQLLTSIITMITILSIMIYFCVWLTLVTLIGIFIMYKITRRIGGKSSRHFKRQQKNTGALEGFAEEIMNGQKVVKVFCHEDESIKQFEKLNEELFINSEKGNKRANTLGPILNNVGNILYVIMALSGGILILSGVKNLSLSGLPISISVVIPFLNMTKQFAMNINHLSMHLNAIISGLAGTGRIYDLIDSAPESDEGENNLKNITGKIKFENVNFGYGSKKVLHDINLTAEPGKKIAIVGSTGAGKTTIANLITRFYDVDDGKILIDDAEINNIKKSELRKNIGIVLQDTNLFTGSVMENIKYGNLNATDEDCINAAKLTNAHKFIIQLPAGYKTLLQGNGSNLSQGQRQLITIARAAVANPAIMVLDEATSSIDTRTEAFVQKGMDALMRGRTVFVIAHRLSTVKNSDLILVMEHGEIIERGTHEELMKLNGRYFKLYTGAFELQ